MEGQKGEQPRDHYRAAARRSETKSFSAVQIFAESLKVKSRKINLEFAESR